MKTVPKHGRNAKRNANKLAKALYKLGGVESGRISKKRKAGEIELPKLLSRDMRCKQPKVRDTHTQWLEGTMTDAECEALMSRIADKCNKAFSCVA